MKSVEKTASRLDGVTHTSAGWKTEKLVIVAKPDSGLDAQKIRDAFADSGFTIKTLEKK